MKPHKFDTISFLSGLVLAGFGLMFLIPKNTEDLINTVADMGSWAWPLILLGLGLALLVPLFVNMSRNDDDDAEEVF